MGGECLLGALSLSVRVCVWLLFSVWEERVEGKEFAGRRWTWWVGLGDTP